MEIHRIYSHDQSNTEKSTYQGGHCSTPRDRVSSRKATISDCRFLEFFQYIVQANHHWLSYTDDDCSSEWRLDDGFLGSPEKFHGHRHISIDIFSDWGDIPKYIYIYIFILYYHILMVKKPWNIVRCFMVHHGLVRIISGEPRQVSPCLQGCHVSGGRKALVPDILAV